MRKRKALRKKTFSKKRLGIKKRKSILKEKNFWVFVFSLFLIGGIFYILFFSDIFEIKEINVFGNSKASTEQLKEIITKRLKTRFFLFRKSIFFINSKNIENTILETFPQIGKVQLKRRLPNIIILEVEERNLFAVFCQESEESKCFKIDNEGIAFEYGEPGQGLLIFSYKKGEFSFKDKVTEEENIKAIVEIKQEFDKNPDIEIQRFLILEDRLTLKTGIGFEIYFDSKENIKDQIFNLDKLLKEKIEKDELESLEYIDLRFGSRVFYK